MSQFRETFTRAGKKDPLLSYDDFASRIFMSGFLTCFLFPITLVLLIKWFRPRRNSLPTKYRLADVHVDDRKLKTFHCACSECKQRRIKEAKPTTLISEWCKWQRILQIVVLALLWWLVVYLIKGINVSQNIKRFDPFALLGVAADASIKDVKRAYRHMSLKFHPDRNPNDPAMAAHFILITKAYKALTNEQSRLNYERYGNPDGPGMMKIGIGLPRFLIDENNQVIILSMFFIILLLVMPGLFIWYYNRQKLYAATGIRIDTLQLIYYTLNENTRHKSLPEIYSCTAECCAVPSKAGDEAHLKRYLGGFSDFKRKNIGRETFRNFVVLLCHMNRNAEELPESLKEAQAEILKYSMLITQCMFDVCICKGWGLTLKSILDFRRCLIQALSAKKDSFLQVPHFTSDLVAHVQRGKNPTKSVMHFVDQPPSERRGVANMSPTELEDVEAFCTYFPRVELLVKVYVVDSEEICLGDLLTVEIILKRKNLPPGYDLVGPVHAPLFPWVKYEEWCFVLAYSDKPDELLAFSSSQSREAEIEQKIQITLTKHGNVSLTVTAYCDSYFDCEVDYKVDFVAKVPTSVENSDFKIHPEDLALDFQQSAFGKMIGDILGVESSDEEEEVVDD